jgi:hypothetical protein
MSEQLGSPALLFWPYKVREQSLFSEKLQVITSNHAGKEPCIGTSLLQDCLRLEGNICTRDWFYAALSHSHNNRQHNGILNSTPLDT